MQAVALSQLSSCVCVISWNALALSSEPWASAQRLMWAPPISNVDKALAVTFVATFAGADVGHIGVTAESRIGR